MPQFCMLFYANYTILATQRGGHGTMPPPKYAPATTHPTILHNKNVGLIVHIEIASIGFEIIAGLSC